MAGAIPQRHPPSSSFFTNVANRRIVEGVRLSGSEGLRTERPSIERARHAALRSPLVVGSATYRATDTHERARSCDSAWCFRRRRSALIPPVIRDYAQAAEGAGYDHLLVFDHVLGGTLERFDTLGRRPPYTDESPFHEPFVLFGYLGACTQRLELVTGIVILPQRQTALVAKQAAAVDVLTGGRLRLGVGIGWNHVEYEALERGLPHAGPARQRADRRHAQALDRARGDASRARTTTSTAPASIRCPSSAPSRCGSAAWREPVLRRVAQISDGWFPQFQPGDEARPDPGSRARAT